MMSPQISRKRHFTLVELVVTLMIIGLVTTLAVSTFRGESPYQQLDRAALEFQTFCARVRYQAMEQGKDRVIVLEQADQTLYMALPETIETEDADYTEIQEENLPDLHWKLPDKMHFSNTGNESDSSFTDADGESDRTDGRLELFRFFPDGGASGKRKLILICGNIQKIIDISALTGLVRCYEPEKGELP